MDTKSEAWRKHVRFCEKAAAHRYAMEFLGLVEEAQAANPGQGEAGALARAGLARPDLAIAFWG